MLCSDPIIIARDPKCYLSFPDITITPQEECLCVYREAPKHHPTESTIILQRSSNGVDWEKIDSLSASIRNHGFVFNCPRVGWVDGHLYLLCDIKTSPMEGGASWGIYYWPISDELKVLDPINLQIQGMVPDHIIEYKNEWMLGYHVCDEDQLTQMVAHSRDGIYWRDRSTIATNDRLFPCEGSIVSHDGSLICFMRDNVNPEAIAHQAISTDGRKWSVLQPIPITAHRIVAGVKQHPPYKNAIIGTYRDTINRAVSLFIKHDEWETHILASEKKNSLYDFGYTGWVENKDGSLLVVYYMCGEYPKPQIFIMRVEL